MKNKILLTTLISSTLLSCGSNDQGSQFKEGWNPQNAPENMGVSQAVDFRTIPTSARLPAAKLPWSGHYWATFQGGIAHRWQKRNPSTDYRQHVYQPAALNQYLALDDRGTEGLSPAEKYDLLTMNPRMSLTVNSLNQTLASVKFGKVETWFGQCHGWAVASYMEPRPIKPVTLQNDRGQQVKFLPSDIKALVTQFYADSGVSAQTIGNRCNSGSGPLRIGEWLRVMRRSSECRDTNPGAFHLTVTEYIAKRQESFVAEIDKNAEVWNHPVVGYQFQYSNLRQLRRFLTPFQQYDQRAKFLVDVEMYLEYATETAPGDERVAPATKSLPLRYQLELDEYARIVGGKWLSTEYPDFLWKLSAKPQTHPLIDRQIIDRLLKESQY